MYTPTTTIADRFLAIFKQSIFIDKAMNLVVLKTVSALQIQRMAIDTLNEPAIAGTLCMTLCCNMKIWRN